VAFSPDGKTILTGCGDGLTRFFSMPELPDDPERAAAWIEVLTGLTLDAWRGSIHILDNAAWRASRARLERLGGQPETVPRRQLDPIAYGPDPTARARTWIERKCWPEAEAAFDEVIRARPLSISLWAERGRFHVMRSRFGKAAEDFARAEELDPDDPHLRYERAVSLLLAGDLAGYRAACAAMLSRFKDDESPNAANLVAYACIYGPDPVVDVPGMIRLAERSALRNAGGSRLLGAALYRAGRFTEALSRFQESHRVFQPRGRDWLFLAMIHGRLGHAEEARRMLEEADRWIAEVDRATQDSGGTGPSWPNEFGGPTIRLLRGEAEAVTRFDPIFPPDPFVP
jgi:tetratricopeptide (TPR) repeat protein